MRDLGRTSTSLLLLVVIRLRCVVFRFSLPTAGGDDRGEGLLVPAARAETRCAALCRKLMISSFMLLLLRSEELASTALRDPNPVTSTLGCSGFKARSRAECSMLSVVLLLPEGLRSDLAAFPKFAVVSLLPPLGVPRLGVRSGGGVR